MKIRDMTEREFNRFSNFKGQIEKAYESRENSYRTEAIYKNGMEQFCKYLAVETKLNNINNFKARNIFRFVEKLKSDGLSASTQKNYLAAIRNYADRTGIDKRTIPDNHRLGLEQRSFGNVDRTWTIEEFFSFKELAKEYDQDKGIGPRMELILDIALNFGCRLEGILGLDLNAINKALDTGELWTKEKNGKMNCKSVETLEQVSILEKVKKYGLENGNNKIFIDSHFYKVYKEVENFISNNRKEIQAEDRVKSIEARKYYKENGEVMRANLTIHGLRHTYLQNQVKRLLNEGKELKEACIIVSRLAGHNREQVTKIYLALAKEFRRR